MKLKEILQAVEGKLLNNYNNLDMDFSTAYSTDLLSDVLALTNGETLLITGIVTMQVIKVAKILGITAIIFIRGKMPSEEVLSYASDKIDIPLIFTKKTMFETSGILYVNNVKPCENSPADEV